MELICIGKWLMSILTVTTAAAFFTSEIHQPPADGLSIRIISMTCQTSDEVLSPTARTTCRQWMSPLFTSLPPGAVASCLATGAFTSIAVNDVEFSIGTQGFNVVAFQYAKGVLRVLHKASLDALPLNDSGPLMALPDESIVLVAYHQQNPLAGFSRITPILKSIGGGRVLLQPSMAYTLVGYRAVDGDFPEWVSEHVHVGNVTHIAFSDTGTMVLQDFTVGTNAAWRIKATEGKTPWYMHEYLVLGVSAGLGLSIITHLVILASLLWCYRKGKLLVWKRNKMEVKQVGRYASYTSLTRYGMEGVDSKHTSADNRRHSATKRRSADASHMCNILHECHCQKQAGSNNPLQASHGGKPELSNIDGRAIIRESERGIAVV